MLPSHNSHRERRVVSRVLFYLSLKVHGKESPPPSFPAEPLIERDASFQNLLLYISLLIEKKSLVLDPYIPTLVLCFVLEPSENQISPWTCIGSFGLPWIKKIPYKTAESYICTSYRTFTF